MPDSLIRAIAEEAGLLQGPLVVYAAKTSKQVAKTAKGAAKNVKKATTGARKAAKTTSTDQWYGPDRAQFLGKPPTHAASQAIRHVLCCVDETSWHVAGPFSNPPSYLTVSLLLRLIAAVGDAARATC